MPMNQRWRSGKCARRSRRPRAGEGIEHQVARVRGTGHDRPEQGQGELSREVGHPFGMRPCNPRDRRIDAPDVIPELAVGIGTSVVVEQLPIAAAADLLRPLREHELAGIRHEPEPGTRATSEHPSRVDAERLKPRDPLAEVETEIFRPEAERAGPFVIGQQPERTVAAQRPECPRKPILTPFVEFIRRARVVEVIAVMEPDVIGWIGEDQPDRSLFDRIELCKTIALPDLPKPFGRARFLRFRVFIFRLGLGIFDGFEHASQALEMFPGGKHFPVPVGMHISPGLLALEFAIVVNPLNPSDLVLPRLSQPVYLPQLRLGVAEAIAPHSECTGHGVAPWRPRTPHARR